MKLSVIIPTHNRADILKTCLEKVLSQQGQVDRDRTCQGVDFEVIVVDDGSTDNTEEIIKQFINHVGAIGQSRLHGTGIRYIKQPASHQAIARNRGVKEATGDIIIFIGDDIFVEPDFLMEHCRRHAEYPDENIVVLGYTTWDPSLEINPYMKFLESSGWQFGYRFLHPKFIGRTDPYKFFYTSNISLKKSFFEKERFNEDFSCYGWEDVELGYRLWKHHNMKIYYEPRAIAYHHHQIPESGLTEKMRNIGKSAVLFRRLQPDIRVIPVGLKAFAIKSAGNKWALRVLRLLGKNTYYKFRSWREFFEGVKEAA
jgi:glycosyltransferase involved in cell wall biosynthesis